MGPSYSSPRTANLYSSMSRLALSLGAASANPVVGGQDDPWFLTWTIPYVPTETISGVTVTLSDNITHTFSEPTLTYDLQTTAKTATLKTTMSGIWVGHYKTHGTVEGMNLGGEGDISFVLSGGESITLSYTSTSADSWCAVPGSWKVGMSTTKADLVITGMEDSTVHDLITGFVASNQATLGSTVADLINTNYGADINKYLTAIINSICGDLPPPPSQ